MSELGESAQAYLRRYRDDVRARAGDPPWLAELRQRAADRFGEQGFPAPTEEDWKYTNVRPIVSRIFQAAAPELAQVDAERLKGAVFPELDAHRLVFVNGRFTPAFSTSLDELPRGVRLNTLVRALDEGGEAVQTHLGRYGEPAFSGFAALNTAFLDDGACVQLEDGAVCERPIHLVFASTGGAESVISHPRVLVVAGRNSQASVIEHYVALDEATNFQNAVTEIVLGEGAVLAHDKLQQESEKSFHVASVHVHQCRDSRYVSHNINLGGLLVRNDIRAALTEPGAEARLYGLFMAGGRQHVDNHTCIDHMAPHTRSDESYKGVLSGRARGVFNGRVVVRPDAQKIEARQSNPNLLLSGQAEIDTKPELEIYADDVKCSHGATVGQLDETALFYLRSRGLDAETARDLLVFGFVEEVIDGLAHAPIRDRLESTVKGRLPESGRLKDLL